VIDNNPSKRDNQQGAAERSRISAPSITLPKGGGAIKGIGEKFAANPVTGAGSMSMPLATSPGRSGFGPQLSLSYDSGAGNGPFGFGWSLSLPQITRKTDKGLPKYLDAEESDVFVLSGAEDLVPVLVKQGDSWVAEKLNPRTVDGKKYEIKRYRPRIEGLFARIERWTEIDTGEIHWHSISRDNILTIYGRDNNSRIFDPAEIPDSGNIDEAKPKRIFSWLICETRDDKGNAVLYQYKEEDGAGVDLSKAHERNRGGFDDKGRRANRYLKRIYYGNRTTLLDNEGKRPVFLTENQIKDTKWMFEVVFDYLSEGKNNEEYGQHYRLYEPDAEGRLFAKAWMDEQGQWNVRLDPFSSYRSGFEVRTCRLCRRVLMFHHFKDELGADDYLVRSTEFLYSESPIGSFIKSVTQSGYALRDGRYLKKSLPPLEFEYSTSEIDDTVREVDDESLENLPFGLDGTNFQWVDLDGEGISGILTEQAGAWYYKRNTSANNIVKDNGTERVKPRFSASKLVSPKPNESLSTGAQFMDLAGDGQLDLVELEGPVAGFYERTNDQGWEPFRTFGSMPDINLKDPNLKFVDLTGDGHADIMIAEDRVFTWYPSIAEEGFGTSERVSQALDEENGPRLVFADGTQSIYLADLSGDGLSDLARIRNGEVCYWPNLGYGKFGPKVTMDNSPWFDNPDLFDQKRIRLADIDGSGTTDIIYLKSDGVAIYRNECGNRWSDPEYLMAFPQIDNISSVMAVDLLGNGTACLVWSSPLPGNMRRPMRYIRLMKEKPHLLISSRNNLGAETTMKYSPSTKFYLQDRKDGKPWITRLPFPMHVVERVSVHDKWRNTTFSTTYSYHHGYFDGIEREFRGFGRVEQIDVEDYGTFAQGNAGSPYITNYQKLYQPPVKTVTWYHIGAFFDREKILSHFSDEYFPKWLKELQPDQSSILGTFTEHALPEPDLERVDLTSEKWREALRACKGLMLRQEVYELDVDALADRKEVPVKLFTTAFHNCDIRMLQPMATNRHAVFHVTENEAITYHYELDLRPTSDPVGPDPRIDHTLNLRIDEYGNIQQQVVAVYGRGERFADISLKPEDVAPIIKEQSKHHLAYSESRYASARPLEMTGFYLLFRHARGS
jgi:Salmonella virulence plasmid 65kDa B protein/Insecticide toxin TcdB middle/N-terminal region/Insecticide toxin TcdB middle/C-terminal region